MGHKISDLKNISKKTRKDVLKMTMKSKSAHLGSNFSVIDILTVLYFEIMNIDSKNPYFEDRDRLILSKGHAAASIYATLAEKGFFKKNKLDEFYTDGSTLAGHVSYKSVPGIEASSGSLGHGLSIANGIALAGKKNNKGYKTFVILSDGECDEGSTWEGILFASHNRLDNLVAVVDYNKWQSFGRTNEVLNLEPFVEKWKDFGWSVKEVDGHDFQKLIEIFENIPFETNKPSVIIAHTIKGKELLSLENTLDSHYKRPSEDEYKEIINNLDKE